MMSGFVPPPAPGLSALEIAAIYRDNATFIRLGMILGLAGIAGFIAMVCVITTQMRHMVTSSRLPAYPPLLKRHCCQEVNGTRCHICQIGLAPRAPSWPGAIV